MKTEESNLRRLFGGDRVLWTIVAMLLIISLMVVYSASYYRLSSGDRMGWGDLLAVAIGLVGMLMAYLVPSRLYFAVAHPLFWLFWLLTIITPGRDLRMGGGFNFSPFEVMKVALVMVLARELGRNMLERILPMAGNRAENIKILKSRTLLIFLPILAACVATYVRIGNSTTLLIGITAILMLYMGLTRWSDMAVIIGSVVLVGALMFVVGVGRGATGQSRMSNWWRNVNVWTARVDSVATGSGGEMVAIYDSSDEHDQNVAAKMAIASGRIVGKGPGMSTLRPALSRAESDFAYAFIVEEYGLIGGLLVLFLFVCFFYRAMVVFLKCRSGRPALLVLGLATMLTLQAFIHMSVSVSLIPNTGQQLPLISKGGSSVICTLIAIGMILGISRQKELKGED